MFGEKTFLSPALTPFENLIYRVMRIDQEEQMNWKKYAVSVLLRLSKKSAKAGFF